MEELIGKVSHFYSKIGVAAVKLSKPLKVGDRIHIKGATTDFEDVVRSMQIGHQSVESAKKGAEIGIKVKDKVRDGDEVYIVSE